MLVKCLQICARVFIDLPQNCAQTSFRSCPRLRPNFGHSRSKLCPIMCRSRTKLCPNFGRCDVTLRARLCPISFAPCPFPNRAGTLNAIEATSGGTAQLPQALLQQFIVLNGGDVTVVSRDVNVRVDVSVINRQSTLRYPTGAFIQ